MMVLVMKNDRPPPVALVPGTYVVDAEKVAHSIDSGIRAGPEPNARRLGSSPRTDRHSRPPNSHT
jgi:hypothetical protein